MGGFQEIVPAGRTLHIRMDHLKNKDGLPVPRDTPYAVVLECGQEIFV